MKKFITLTTLLITLAFTGCGTSSTQTTNTNNQIRTVTQPTAYEILANDKYPASQLEYQDINSSVSIYHSDIQKDTTAFKSSYKSLTGQEYKKDFDGTIVIAKAGVKNNSSYKMMIEDIEDSGRYTNISLSITKSEGCLTSQVLTSPYVIIMIPNHKEVKYTIEEKVIKCK